MIGCSPRIDINDSMLKWCRSWAGEPYVEVRLRDSENCCKNQQVEDVYRFSDSGRQTGLTAFCPMSRQPINPRFSEPT